MKKLVILLLMAFILLAARIDQPSAPIEPPGIQTTVWHADVTYSKGEEVLILEGAWCETYISLSDKNIGNYPPDTLKVWWDQ